MELNLPKESGIYCFENLINGKKYVGQAQNIHIRVCAHIRELKNGSDNSRLLQRAWNKYGKENFQIYSIELLGISLLNDAEIYYINLLHSHYSENGYNISYGGDSVMRGLKHSEESRKKMGESHMGTKRSNETKKKMSDSGKNHMVSEETKIKISIARKGYKVSEETKKKISDAQIGVAHSKATKDKISKSKIGKKRGKNTTSKYLGVYLRNKTYKWVASISNKYIGQYNTELEAAMAYNKMALEIYGENVKLNMIEQEENE